MKPHCLSSVHISLPYVVTDLLLDMKYIQDVKSYNDSVKLCFITGQANTI